MSFALLPSKKISIALGERARRLRLAQNLTQAEVAAMAGTSQGTINRLESGSTVSFDNFIKVAEALGRVDDFYAVFRPEPSLSIDELIVLDRASNRRRASKRR